MRDRRRCRGAAARKPLRGCYWGELPPSPPVGGPQACVCASFLLRAFLVAPPLEGSGPPIGVGNREGQRRRPDPIALGPVPLRHLVPECRLPGGPVKFVQKEGGGSVLHGVMLLRLAMHLLVQP